MKDTIRKEWEQKHMDDELIIVTKVPETVGWIETALPKTVMMRLQSYIETAKKYPVNLNSTLVGNISKSLVLEDKDDWFFNTILVPLSNKFMESYPAYTSRIDHFTQDAPYCLESLWVNFQKETEFNPPHDHKGIFSFVIWVKIPTDWREQHAIPISADSNKPCASNFEFQFTTMLGGIAGQSFLLEKKLEGGMLFFPAKLLHHVHPFYNCDKERISISGNINFDISENSMRQHRAQQKLRQKSKMEL